MAKTKKDVTVEYMMSVILTNLTPIEVAAKLHCCITSVHYWKEGERKPRYHARRAIAALYQREK